MSLCRCLHRCPPPRSRGARRWAGLPRRNWHGRSARSLILGSADGRATVGQVAEALGLRQPTVTHHVRILVEDELLVREREGKYVWLSVAADRLAAIEDLLR